MKSQPKGKYRVMALERAALQPFKRRTPISITKLNKLLKQKYYVAEVMHLIAYMLRDEPKPKQVEEVNSNVFKFKASIDCDVILKADYRDRVTLEGAIGFQLNKLRGTVPNFVFFYKNSLEDSYNLLELIEGVTFTSIMSSSKQFFHYYLQILLALYAAQKQCKFTHSDLHPNNIIMRPTGKLYFKYQFEGRTLTLKCNGYVPTILDFGMSSVDISKVRYGPGKEFRNNFVYDDFCQYRDAIKLACYSAYILRQKRQDYDRIVDFITAYVPCKFIVYPPTNYYNLPKGVLGELTLVEIIKRCLTFI